MGLNILGAKKTSSLQVALVAVLLAVLGYFAVLDTAELRADLTPVATAAEVLMPGRIGLFAVVAAAVAAFASTGNAGILSAARYPLAMSRDRLVWGRLSRLGRHGTPTSAILVTGTTMVVCILLLDVRAIAGLASAFMLLIFGLMNLAVIVMRESRIAAYDPGFRSPAYPWTQLMGIAVTLVLVLEIGLLAAVFTGGLTAACVAWYVFYARHRVTRDGAIYHLFARLGRRQDPGLDRELMEILAEQGVRGEDRFEEVVARASVVELAPGARYDDAVNAAVELLAQRLATDAEALAVRFAEDVPPAMTPVSGGVGLPYILLGGVPRPEMVIVRSQSGVVPEGDSAPVFALFFMVGDRARAGRALRILAQLTAHADQEAFLRSWNVARDEQELKEVMLADERFLSLQVGENSGSAEVAGKALRDLEERYEASP
ncbi:MAG: hypothetical protein WD250_08235 [Egibacteraceae bacterium]